MKTWRADEGYARLYADVYRLRREAVAPFGPVRRGQRRHLRLVPTEAAGSRAAPR
jgi:hypothetical protein